MNRSFSFTRTAFAGAASALALGLFAVAAPRPAAACGGFFCANVPVVQTKEGIIFGVDHTAQTVDATINITYAGSAAEFAWLLPLVGEPTKIEVGATAAFAVVDRLTAPRFVITKTEEVGICGPGTRSLGGIAGGFAPTAAEDASNSDGGVQVLSKAQVGPYDRVVLKGSDPNKVQEWLVMNGYRVTDDMMKTVRPYVAQGDVLLALKLRKDNDAGDIQPIRVYLPGTEACIPIRMTAIAAQDDMDIMALVLSNNGRAIPQNFNHVTPNLARIDWLTRGSNYRQVIAAAADEADGNAFTTEYAGPANIFKEQLYRVGQYNVASLDATSFLDEFIQEVARQGLFSRRETAGILSRNISDETFRIAGVDRMMFSNCPQCFISSFQRAAYDPSAAVAELEERIIKPEISTQELLDKYSYATRLYTLISPEEMNVDPIFSYDAALPAISNVHNARMILDCGVGGSPGSAGVKVILEEEGTTIAFDSNGQPDRTLLDKMPAASRIEQLATGTIIKDNRGSITDLLDEHNSLTQGCGCGTTGRSSDSAAGVAFVAMLGLVLVARRRRS